MTDTKVTDPLLEAHARAVAAVEGAMRTPRHFRKEVDAMFLPDGTEVSVDYKVLGEKWREVRLTLNNGDDTYAVMTEEQAVQVAYALLKAVEWLPIQRARTLLYGVLPKVVDE